RAAPTAPLSTTLVRAGASPARGGPRVPVDGPHLAVVEEAGRELEGGGGRLHEERDHLDDLVVLPRVVDREPAEESPGGQGRPRQDTRLPVEGDPRGKVDGAERVGSHAVRDGEGGRVGNSHLPVRQGVHVEGRSRFAAATGRGHL